MPSASVLGCEGVGRGRSQGSGRSVSVQGCVVGGQVAAGRACVRARSLARTATRLRRLEPLERKVSDAGLQLWRRHFMFVENVKSV